jgi:protocatechuate 3,4-dioxygenase beta subunit
VTILLVGLFSFQSKKETMLPTKLRITVIDGLGNFVEGATVSIYISEDDYRESKNALDSAKTDEKGRALFKDLSPIPYFIDARKADLKNDAEGVQTAPLEEGKLNKVNTIID